MIDRTRAHHIYDRALMWLILGFFVLHMGNHLFVLLGDGPHIAVMDALRVVYRFPILEALLLWSIYRQIRAGIRQTKRFGLKKPRGVLAVLVWSGLYLIGFLVIHMSAVTVARYALGLDTNIYFGAAGYHVMPFALFFYPYYFLAILAGFTHWGAVLWLRNRARDPKRAMTQFRTLTFIGVVMACLVTLGMGGHLGGLTIPDTYLATYR